MFSQMSDFDYLGRAYKELAAQVIEKIIDEKGELREGYTTLHRLHTRGSLDKETTTIHAVLSFQLCGFMVFPIYLSFVSQDKKYGLQCCWLTGSPSAESGLGTVSHLRDENLYAGQRVAVVACLAYTMISAVSPVIGDAVLRNRCIR